MVQIFSWSILYINNVTDAQDIIAINANDTVTENMLVTGGGHRSLVQYLPSTFDGSKLIFNSEKKIKQIKNVNF